VIAMPVQYYIKHAFENEGASISQNSQERRRVLENGGKICLQGGLE